MKHISRLQIFYRTHQNAGFVMLFAVVFGLAGFSLLFISRAATPTATIRPETGSLQGEVAVVDDTNAVNDEAVKFGASIPNSPSGKARPTVAPTGWTQVYGDDFKGTVLSDAAWNRYNGMSNASKSYWNKDHMFVADDVMHLLGKQNATGTVGAHWYNGGGCLCGADWSEAQDVKVSFRVRVVNSPDLDKGEKYAFLRYPKVAPKLKDADGNFTICQPSEIDGDGDCKGCWPKYGEEDFLEGNFGRGDPTDVQNPNRIKISTTTPHYGAGCGGSFDTQGRHRSGAAGFPYVPTDWHTVTYTREPGPTVTLSGAGCNPVVADTSFQTAHVTQYVDGVRVYDYNSDPPSSACAKDMGEVPNYPHHLGFQLECTGTTDACPTTGSVDVQFDWMVVYKPS